MYSCVFFVCRCFLRILFFSFFSPLLLWGKKSQSCWNLFLDMNTLGWCWCSATMWHMGYLQAGMLAVTFLSQTRLWSPCNFLYHVKFKRAQADLYYQIMQSVCFSWEGKICVLHWRIKSFCCANVTLLPQVKSDDRRNQINVPCWLFGFCKVKCSEFREHFI